MIVILRNVGNWMVPFIYKLHGIDFKFVFRMVNDNISVSWTILVCFAPEIYHNFFFLWFWVFIWYVFYYFIKCDCILRWTLLLSTICRHSNFEVPTHRKNCPFLAMCYARMQGYFVKSGVSMQWRYVYAWVLTHVIEILNAWDCCTAF